MCEIYKMKRKKGKYTLLGCQQVVFSRTFAIIEEAYGSAMMSHPACVFMVGTALSAGYF